MNVLEAIYITLFLLLCVGCLVLIAFLTGLY